MTADRLFWLLIDAGVQAPGVALAGLLTGLLLAGKCLQLARVRIIRRDTRPGGR